MDATAHYRHLLQLGREEFLASAAPAALVRYRHGSGDLGEGGVATMTIDQEINETIEETVPIRRDLEASDEATIEVYPLTKKPGASFPDRITIGRTPNNDIVIVDHSVSRLHAYVRQDGGRGSWPTRARRTGAGSRAPRSSPARSAGSRPRRSSGSETST